MAGGAIFAEKNSSLSSSGSSNFTHNSAEYGGAIAANDNVMVTFHGTNNFVSNSANNNFIAIRLVIIVLVVQFVQDRMLHLLSMELTTSSTTQQIHLVVQFLQE